MTTTDAAGYIVYQSGFAVFGTGETPEAAEADAAEWADGEIDAAEGGRGEVHGEWYYLPATARLIAAVAERGGQIGFDVVGGVADEAGKLILGS
jgi:hypothetical protein